MAKQRHPFPGGDSPGLAEVAGGAWGKVVETRRLNIEA